MTASKASDGRGIQTVGRVMPEGALDTLTGPGRGSADLLMATVWSN